MTTKHILISVFISLIFALGCKSQSADKSYVLTPEERTICDSLQLDTTIIKDIRGFNVNKIEPFHYSLSKIITKDAEIEADPIFLKGLVFSETNSRSYDLIFSLKDIFKEKSKLPFTSKRQTESM